MLYFDLDGVIRDLAATIYPSVIFDDWRTPIHGQDFISYFSARLHLLRIAPPTEYYEVIKSLIKNPIIITAQSPDWQEPTTDWINTWLPEAKIIFDNKKLHLLGKEDIIVEDCPNYDDYSQVVLIDRPYNRCVKNPCWRITSPERLRSYLEYML